MRKKKKIKKAARLIHARAVIALLIIACGFFLVKNHIANNGGFSLTKMLLSFGMPIDETAEHPDEVNVLELTPDEDEAEIIDIVVEPQENAATIQNMDLKGSQPRILIYHTHTTEAYTQTSKDKYIETGSWRTKNEDKNIVAVGEKLASLLRDKYGFAVLHDKTNHEPPALKTSYSRSLETMEDYKSRYPSLTTFIDVHRDAYNVKGENKDFVEINGKRYARMMFVVGTGKGATGTGFDVMPDFEANYALAKAITDKLTAIHPKLMREIRVKTGRYNQHITNQCLLVEIGHNANTLEEALNSIELLAQAIASVAGEDISPTDAAVQTGGAISLVP